MFDYGRGRQGLIPLWVGEGDLPTPRSSRAAKASIDRGETFYTPQPGIPALREAIAGYMTRVYGRRRRGASRPKTFRHHRRHACARHRDAPHVGPGDEALIPSPAWPNFAGAIARRAAAPFPVPLGRAGRWGLDPTPRGAVTPATKGVFLNSPANPTGFVATREELDATLRRPPAWPLDRRRRDLRPADLQWRPRALVPRHHGAGRQDSVRPDLPRTGR